MNHAQSLKNLLAPLGVYRWGDSFQWGELQSAGAALDGVSAELETIQRERNLTTAEDEGLAAICSLLAHPPATEDPERLRRALAALLRIGGDSFTLAAINDNLSGCGIPAVVEETDTPLTVAVYFPGTGGVPDFFEGVQSVIEDILPCHLGIDYRFHYIIWTELEAQFPTWQALEDGEFSWRELERQILD